MGYLLFFFGLSGVLICISLYIWFAIWFSFFTESKFKFNSSFVFLTLIFVLVAAVFTGIKYLQDHNYSTFGSSECICIIQKDIE